MIDMKSLKSILLLTAIALCATGCGAKKKDVAKEPVKLEAGSDIIVNFSELISLDEVLEDIQDIDFYLALDKDGLTTKEDVDEESSTSIVKYYKEDGTLVYEEFIGYGETCFVHYTTTKRGRTAAVKYIDSEGARAEVIISTDEYEASFSDLNKELDYGADYIFVNVLNSGVGVVSDCVTYEFSQGKWIVSSAKYFAEDGYHSFYTYLEEGKPVSEDIVTINSGKAGDATDISKIAHDKLVKNLDILAGEHRLSYDKSGGDMRWMVSGNYILEFNNNDDARAFADAYGYEAVALETDEETMVVNLGELTLLVSDTYESFRDFASFEYNDYMYMTVKLDDNGEITEITREGTTLSYY